MPKTIYEIRITKCPNPEYSNASFCFETIELAELFLDYLEETNLFLEEDFKYSKTTRPFFDNPNEMRPNHAHDFARCVMNENFQFVD